jgi:hypothetical protein
VADRLTVGASLSAASLWFSRVRVLTFLSIRLPLVEVDQATRPLVFAPPSMLTFFPTSVKRDFMTGVWIVFMLLFLRAAWRERDTYPLSWSGYGHSSNAPVILIGSVLFVALYFWWSNRRDSK